LVPDPFSKHAELESNPSLRCFEQDAVKLSGRIPGWQLAVSGMKTMSNRKFIRRTFLAAALTMSGAHATTASGFQQGQYQPGQPGQQIPQGNSTVSRELNRMFQESGQQMPSMNAKELPNANVPTQGQVRPRQTPNQLQVNTNSVNPAQAKPKASSGKQSVLGRFFGKLRGDTGNSDPNYQPPVPPDDGAASPIPPRSGATVRAANPRVPASPTPGASRERTEYIQPGPAPGFMSTAGAVKVIQKQPAATPSSSDKFQDQFIRDNTGATAGTRRPAGTASPEVAVKKTTENTFESPFRDSAESLEGTEILDLDSLIEIPAATPQPGTAVANKKNSFQPENSEATQAAEEPSDSAREFVESSTSENAGKDMLPGGVDGDSVKAPEENPFTGVQLNTSDAQFFNIQGPTTGVDAGSFGDAASPMEDFNSNLPAIDLPSVDLPSVDLPPVDDEDADAQAELIETPTGVTIQPTEDATHAKTKASASTAARAELPPNVDDSEPISPDVPEALSATETARLRQTVEQERRQFQQRQIQARPGQSGFKGFCPVALRERRELVESSDQFTSTFGLQTYKFSSAESKAAFDTDPARYAPAAGGSDVVVLVNSGEEQVGQLDYALWYRDRLYLFRSRETMTLFSKDPQRFASQY